MDHHDCIFCKIIAHQTPAKKIEETEDIIVIQDIAPKAPVHYLIIPKKHITDIIALQESDTSVASNMIFMAKKLSLNLPGIQDFKLLVNNGANAGQRVFHLHFHFLSGRIMSEF